ncbi:MAG: hypothetical protein ACMG6S_27440 [Byssovorax sp.]
MTPRPLGSSDAREGSADERRYDFDRRAPDSIVPIVVGIAVVTFVVWSLVGPEPRMAHALINAVAVLIVRLVYAGSQQLSRSAVICAAR